MPILIGSVASLVKLVTGKDTEYAVMTVVSFIVMVAVNVVFALLTRWAWRKGHVTEEGLREMDAEHNSLSRGGALGV